MPGQILGKAASLIDQRESTLTQSYGPEARGGACSAQVIISSSTIHYPYVRNPDILVCLSQEGYDKFHELLKDGGTLIVDQDLIQPRRTRAPPISSPSRPRVWRRNWATK